MNDLSQNLLDPRLEQALRTRFNGATLKRNIGDCTILSAIRKQTGQSVDIYAASYVSASDDAVAKDIVKAFQTYEAINSENLQAAVRVWKDKAFRRSPILAMLACEHPVFDDAFDARGADVKIDTFRYVMEGLADLHDVGLVHGALSADAIRRESEGGAVRICDFGFSGGRKTSITGQPITYQSRHVLTQSEPSAFDDVYAAGMIGYRIFLGAHGPEQVLTGKADAIDHETTVAAILGEARAAPTGADLALGDHAAAKDIARLLERMTARDGDQSGYSDAATALNALRTVLGLPIERETIAEAQPAAEAAVAAEPSTTASLGPLRRGSVGRPAPTASSQPRKFSPATAVFLFLGALAGLAGTTHFYSEAQAVDGAVAAGVSMVDAQDNVTRAELSGALTASDDTATAAEEADALLSTAKSAFIHKNFDIAAAHGAKAATAADAVAKRVAVLREDAGVSQAKAAEALTGATTAYSGETAEIRALRSVFSTAKGKYDTGHIAESITIWSDVKDRLASIVEVRRAAAEDARDKATSARNGILNSADAGAVALSDWLMRQGEDRFDALAFADSEAAYLRAAAALDRGAETRSIKIGSTPDEMADAVELCLTSGVGDSAACPTARDAGEVQRTASVNPFILDPTEVKIAQFERFLAETGHIPSARGKAAVTAVTQTGSTSLANFVPAVFETNTTNGQEADLPVTRVTMTDAEAYCAYAGGRIPTEAEWEFAARSGADGAFPWGDWASDRAVWRGAPDTAKRLPQISATGTDTVNLSGNVREWVWAEDGAVLKGGSFLTTNPADLRIAARLLQPENTAGVDFGIRCAYDKETW